MFRTLLLMFAIGVVSPMIFATDAAADEIVRYRLESWKRKHLHDSAKADKIADTLKKLGCDVEKADHNGHIDVKYRCPQWRQISLDSHEEAGRWVRWFKTYHFQTEHKH